MSSFSSLQSFPTTTERSTRCIRRNTNQVISNGVCKCVWERCHYITSAAGKQAAHHPRFAGVGLAAARPPCPGLLWEPGEEGSAGATARGGRAVPALCSPPWARSHRAWGAALPTVMRTHWVFPRACVQGHRKEWKVWVLLLLCHISTIFDNRKANRRIAELSHWWHCLRRLE